MVEDPLPDAGTLMMLCGEMVPAQRPLKPTRVERKKVLMQDITGRVFKNPKISETRPEPKNRGILGRIDLIPI